MIKKISFEFSVKFMLILLLLVLVYHMLILTELVPYDAVWGGRLESRSQMQAFELVSITVNVFIIAIIAIKGGYLSINISNSVVNIFLWIIATIYALNTVGNLYAMNIWETVIFTPLTFISTLLCIRMAIEK